MGGILIQLFSVIFLWYGCVYYVRASSLIKDVSVLPRIFRPVLGRSQWVSKVDSAHQKDLDQIYDKLTLWSQTGNNRSQCQSSLRNLTSDLVIGKSYAIKAFDSTGKLESGLLMGNYKWLGRYYECLDISQGGFQGKWCSISSGRKSPITGNVEGLTVGICLPNTCTEDDLTDFLSFISNRSSSTNRHVDCPVQPSRWTAADVVFVFVLSILTILLMMGTLLEIYHNRAKRSDEMSVDGDDATMLTDAIPDDRTELTGWRKTLLCFSLIKNTKSLLKVERRPDTIDCLHGLRFISITWVILGHLFYHLLEKVDNIADMYNYMVRNITCLVITNAFMAVDTFFFISGVLVAYLALLDIDRFTVKLVPKLYVQRYLRLTPSYAFVILFVVGFSSKLGNGPFWPETFYTVYKDTCEKYWWTNLLYISNLYPSTIFEQCFSAGWYLDNDMQFFMLAPISLLVMKRSQFWSISLILFGIFSSILVTGVVSSHYSLQPLSIIPSIGFKTLNITNWKKVNQPPAMDKSDEFWSDTYVRPWCRISVYLIGMLTGYILVATKSRMAMSKALVILGWAAAAALNLSVLYGTWWYVQNSVPMETNSAAFYDAMSRPAWACGLAWVVIACATGNGGPANTFLCWKALIPLSRLTYCMYLVHTPILYIWLLSLEVDYHFTMVQMPIFYLGFLTFTCGAGYALSILVEIPLLNLMKSISERHTSPQLADRES